MANRLLANASGNLAGNLEVAALRDKEFEVAEQLRAEGIIEEIYVKPEGQGAYFVLPEMNEAEALQHLRKLPFFPFFDTVTFSVVNKAF